MAEEEMTLNEDTESVDDAGSSPDVELRPIKDGSGFTSTTEFEPVEKADEKVDPETDISDETEQKTETDKSKPEPFHKHPDWIKREEKHRAEVEALNQRLESLESVSKKKEQSVDVQEPMNIMALSDDDLSEMQLNEPKKFTALVAQRLLWEIEQRDKETRQKETQKSFEHRINKTFEDFFKDKEDGMEMVKDGRIKRFIDENPGHNAISAYHALAGKTIIQKEVEAAIKKERDKINRELKAAGKANTVSTTTASKTYNEKSFGKPATNKADLKAAMVNYVRDRRTA